MTDMEALGWAVWCCPLLPVGVVLALLWGQIRWDRDGRRK